MKTLTEHYYAIQIGTEPTCSPYLMLQADAPEMTPAMFVKRPNAQARVP